MLFRKRTKMVKWKLNCLSLIAFFIFGCSSSHPSQIQKIYSTDSNQSHSFKVWLEPDKRQYKAGQTIQTNFHIQGLRTDNEQEKLLKGRFLYTFVSENSHEVTTTTKFFSGGGGIDYTGATPVPHKISAPEKTGKYLLYATVISTKKDIKGFLMTARMKASAGPWWNGIVSTPFVHIQVKN